MSTDVKIVDELIDHFLVQAKRYGDATLDPDLPDSDFSTNCRMGQQSATIAFLAGQLWVFAPGLAEGAVKRVVDMVADGHELFDWAAAELVERRVDVAAVTAGQLESEAWLKRVGESAAAAAADLKSIFAELEPDCGKTSTADQKLGDLLAEIQGAVADGSLVMAPTDGQRIEELDAELDRLRRYLSHDIHWKMMTTSAHLWGWGALYPHEKALNGTPCHISPKDCDRIVDAAVGKLRELIAQRLAPIEACCDLHNTHCEPPSELCCGDCTEVRHPDHPLGVSCVLSAPSALPDTTQED